MTIFHAPQDTLPAFRELFQQGVGISVKTGTSLENLLCHQWQIDRDYVMGRISTLFLNGQPVDDLAVSIVNDGAVLALSGAMPGLIGATMRRGGILAAFRSDISYRPTEDPHASSHGRITLKLFNLLIDELGPLFLAGGIWVPRTRLTALFPDHPDIEKSTAREIQVVMASNPSPAP